jgi:Flp pilus assembly protein TadB
MDRQTFVRLVLIPGVIGVALFLVFLWVVGAVLPQLSPVVGLLVAVVIVIGAALGIVVLMRSDRRRRARRYSEEEIYHHH